MIRIHRFLLLLLLGAGAIGESPLHAAPVDFTLRPYEYLFDGMTFHGFKFAHGKGFITYLPPLNWTCLGDAKAISLRPSEGTSTTRAEITHVEHTPPPVWDQEGINVLIKRAQALLPPLATDVQIADVCKNPFLMGGHETIRFVFTGRLLAQNYKFSVVLLPLDDEEFSFVMYSEKTEFEAVAALWTSSLYSLRWEKSER